MIRILSKHIDKKVQVIFWTYSVQVLTLFIGFANVKILTSFLSIKEYGIYAEFFALLSMCTILLSLNLGHGFIRFSSGMEDNIRRSYFWTTIIMQSFIAVIFFAIVFLLSSFISYDKLFFNEKPLLFLLALASLLGLIQAQLMNNLIVRGKFIQNAGVSAGVAILSFTGSTLGAIIYRSVSGVISMGILSGFISILSVGFFQRLSIKYAGFSKEIAIKLVKFGLPLLIGGFSYWAINSGNRLLISHYLGLEALGRFSVLMTIPGNIIIIYTSLNTIFLSSLSKIYGNKLYGRVDYWLNKVYMTYALLSFALAASLSIIGKEVIQVISTSEYVFPEINIAMFIAGIQSSFFGLYMILLKLYDLSVKQVKSMFTSVVVVFVALFLNMVLIPCMGITGSLIGNNLAIISGILIIRISKFSHLKPVFDDLKVIALLMLTIFLVLVVNCFTIELLVVKVLFALLVFIIIVAVGFIINMLSIKDLFISKSIN